MTFSNRMCGKSSAEMRQKMNKMNYRIALQSKEMLIKGLLKIMETEDYTMITVTQICQEAKLSRRTFYRLYTTKDDVLQEYMGSLSQEFLNVITELEPKHYSEVVMSYFEFWKRHEAFLLMLSKNRMLDIIYRTAEGMARSILQRIKPQVQMENETLSFSLAYSIGGMNGILIKWVQDGMKTTPEQIKVILEKALLTAMI